MKTPAAEAVCLNDAPICPAVYNAAVVTINNQMKESHG